MADPTTNWIDFWISLSGVTETAIWAGLIGTVIVRFRRPIENVVTSISSRVEKGDSIDFFGLKLESVKKSAEFEAELEVSVREVVSELISTSSDATDTRNLSNEIIRRVRERHSLIIDFSSVVSTGSTIRSVPYDQFESIGLLLRYIWLEARAFSRNSYNSEWIIKNERTGSF